MRNHERKFPRVKSAKQLKPFCTRTSGDSPFPMGTEIVLDKKRAVKDKTHEIVWKSGKYFGAVGDRCAYVSHEELFELAEKGFIELTFA